MRLVHPKPQGECHLRQAATVGVQPEAAGPNTWMDARGSRGEQRSADASVRPT